MTPNILTRIFGWPHELLHVLALVLIGRRPEAVAQTHVDIPDDLSTAQYVFVAGLPALVFWPLALFALRGVFAANGILPVLGWGLLTSVTLMAAIGTLGDLYLIAMRLLEED